MSKNPSAAFVSQGDPAVNHLPQAGVWFPPFGAAGTQQPAAAGAGVEGSTFAATLKLHEDKVAELIGNLTDAERAIAYKYLHASGMRIGSVDDDLRKAIRKEIGKGS
jgi:hypothetical protein